MTPVKRQPFCSVLNALKRAMVTTVPNVDKPLIKSTYASTFPCVTLLPSTMKRIWKLYISWLVQEIRNSIANAMELRLSCINPSIWWPHFPAANELTVSVAMCWHFWFMTAVCGALMCTWSVLITLKTSVTSRSIFLEINLMHSHLPFTSFFANDPIRILI